MSKKSRPPVDDYQLDAVKQMHTGCILCGGVGSGKSRTALTYFYSVNGGDLDKSLVFPMHNPKDLYIITTARKRDTHEWESELCPFLLSPKPCDNHYQNRVAIDSWNNITKYTDVEDAFFIFDEQRVVGKGTWVKSFLKITKSNEWILLSATPGDTWSDYIPVFIANGFYRNRTDFIRQHIVWARGVKYPKVDRYLDTGRLIRLRRRVLVDMDYHRPTIRHHERILVDHDAVTYRLLMKTRFDPIKEQPFISASDLCIGLRRVVNSDDSRVKAVLDLYKKSCGRVIIFYNYDYELEILRNIPYGPDVELAEWNGHKHQPIPGLDRKDGKPELKKWVFLVQYAAGSEGWNCTLTDTVIFYSASYSYKMMEQAAGRIDRRNTPYRDLYFYHLQSHAPIDVAINRALKRKKKFNESSFVKAFSKGGN